MIEPTEVRTGGKDEETLDPEDWGSMRKLGHRMLDDMMDYLETLRDRPVWQHPPPHIKSHFETSPPHHPQSPEGVYQEYVEYILPYQLGNSHPRFWGWVLGTGTVMGMFAEMLGLQRMLPAETVLTTVAIMSRCRFLNGARPC